MIVGEDGELVPLPVPAGEEEEEDKERWPEGETDQARKTRDNSDPAAARQQAAGEREGEEGEEEEHDDEEEEEDPTALMHGRSGMRKLDYALWRATENGDVDHVRKYLQLGADANAAHPGVLKWTPMHLAAINDQGPTLELLHEYGAELDLRDASGRTPIRLARKHLKLLAVRALEAMMGYGEGEGSDTDVELGGDVPNELTESLGLNASQLEQLRAHDGCNNSSAFNHPLWKDLAEVSSPSLCLPSLIECVFL